VQEKCKKGGQQTVSVPRAVATGSRKELEDKGAAVKFWTDTNVGATAIHAAGREIEFAYGHFDKGSSKRVTVFRRLARRVHRPALISAGNQPNRRILARFQRAFSSTALASELKP